MNYFPLLVGVVGLGAFITSLTYTPLQPYEAPVLFCFVLFRNISVILWDILVFHIFVEQDKTIHEFYKNPNHQHCLLGHYFSLPCPVLNLLPNFRCQSKLYYFLWNGVFLYISVFATSVGIIVHYILNLNALGKKDLYISQFMS